MFGGWRGHRAQSRGCGAGGWSDSCGSLFGVLAASVGGRSHALLYPTVNAGPVEQSFAHFPLLAAAGCRIGVLDVGSVNLGNFVYVNSRADVDFQLKVLQRKSACSEHRRIRTRLSAISSWSLEIRPTALGSDDKTVLWRGEGLSRWRVRLATYRLSVRGIHGDAGGLPDPLVDRSRGR